MTPRRSAWSQHWQPSGRRTHVTEWSATTATIVMVVTTMVTDAVTEKATGSRPSRLRVGGLNYLA